LYKIKREKKNKCVKEKNWNKEFVKNKRNKKLKLKASRGKTIY